MIFGSGSSSGMSSAVSRDSSAAFSITSPKRWSPWCSTRVRMRWISDEELDARPELVKTMAVQPPRGAGRVRLIEILDCDLQPCGGTHVTRTGEIGPLRVSRIRNEGRRNKRVTLAFVE